jgi:hydroxyacyl-ACP dehydratase HTD2-like protein with hotdog domain
MRPAGEIRQALLTAVGQLMTADRAPTLAELASHAQVGATAAMQTVKNMHRHGALRIVRHRRVAYRNRPVAEYALNDAPGDPVGGVDLGAVLRVWAD